MYLLETALQDFPIILEIKSRNCRLKSDVIFIIIKYVPINSLSPVVNGVSLAGFLVNKTKYAIIRDTKLFTNKAIKGFLNE